MTEMHRTRNRIFALLIVGAGLAAAPALYAQDTKPPAAPTGRPMMGSGMDGMKMMRDMGAMTDACTSMMQSMHHPGEAGDRPQRSPPADSDRKG